MTYGVVGIYVDTPKTKKSKRTITMPTFVMSEIEEMMEYNQRKKEENKAVWQNTDALLKNEIGNPLYPKSLLRWFSKFLKKNKMRHISIKGLRHTHVAMTRSLGSSLEEASRRVGHSQYGTTLNIYDHIFKNSTDYMIAMGLEEKYGKPVSDTDDDKIDVS